MVLAVIVANIPYLPFMKGNSSSADVAWYKNYYLGYGHFEDEWEAEKYAKKELNKLEEEGMPEIIPERAEIEVIVIDRYLR